MYDIVFPAFLKVSYRLASVSVIWTKNIVRCLVFNPADWGDLSGIGLELKHFLHRCGSDSVACGGSKRVSRISAPLTLRYWQR